MRQYHSFIDRNYLIYKAVQEPIQLSSEDTARLERVGLKKSCLERAPIWLRKWASLVCEYVEFEERLYPEFFKSEYPPGIKLDDIKVDAKNQAYTLVQNIAITIDKILHVLESMQTKEPPIRSLNVEESFKKFWTDAGNLRETTKFVLSQMED